MNNKTFTSIVAIAGVNRGGFYFPMPVLIRVVDEYKTRPDNFKFVMEPGYRENDISPMHVVAKVDSLDIDGNGVLRAKFTLLDTPSGALYSDLMKKLPRLKLDATLAGFGNVDENGKVQDDYDLLYLSLKPSFGEPVEEVCDIQ